MYVFRLFFSVDEAVVKLPFELYDKTYKSKVVLASSAFGFSV